MFTLFVNGVPAIKLGDLSELPTRKEKESWLVIDAAGKMIDFYFPA